MGQLKAGIAVLLGACIILLICVMPFVLLAGGLVLLVYAFQKQAGWKRVGALVLALVLVSAGVYLQYVNTQRMRGRMTKAVLRSNTAV